MRPINIYSLRLIYFMIAYKLLWLGVVAYPLWRAGTLAGSPAEDLTYVFLWVPLPIVAVPWGYVWRTYLAWPAKVRGPRSEVRGGYLRTQEVTTRT